MYMHNNHCHWVTAYLQLNILLLFFYNFIPKQDKVELETDYWTNNHDLIKRLEKMALVATLLMHFTKHYLCHKAMGDKTQWACGMQQIYIYIYIYTHTHTYIHTYIYTHTHTHTHTRNGGPSGNRTGSSPSILALPNNLHSTNVPNLYIHLHYVTTNKCTSIKYVLSHTAIHWHVLAASVTISIMSVKSNI